MAGEHHRLRRRLHQYYQRRRVQWRYLRNTHHHRRYSRHEWIWLPLRGHRKLCAAYRQLQLCVADRERGFGDNRSASANGHNLCAQRGKHHRAIGHRHLTDLPMADQVRMVVVPGPTCQRFTVFKCYDCYAHHQPNRRVDERKSIPRCIVGSSCGNLTSNVTTLTVNSAPAITAQPANVSSCAGTRHPSRLPLPVLPLTYQWQGKHQWRRHLG